MIGVTLRIDVPLDHVMREIRLLQNFDGATGREREISCVPDVRIHREGHVAVSIVIPLHHVVVVEYPAIEEAIVVGVRTLPCSTKEVEGIRTTVGVVVPGSQTADLDA